MGNENLLPKNIRQIGEIQGKRKIYLEDYVMTYIRKMENRGNDDFLGILLGERKCTEEAEYVFVRGIMEVPGEADGEQPKMKTREASETGQTQREPRGAAASGLKTTQITEANKTKTAQIIEANSGEKPAEGKEAAGESAPEKEKTGLWQAFQKRYGTQEEWTSEEEQGSAGKQDSAIPKDRWERFRREQAAHFPGSQVVGCCVIGTWETGRMEELTGQIPEAKQMLYHLQDQEERLYWLEGERYEGIAGYFVFYEQNRWMQEYLSELFGESSVEKESAPDKAIISFREKVKNKADEKSRSFLKLASSFFVVGALLVGVVAVNRVSDLRQAANVAGTSTASLEAGQGTLSDSGDDFLNISDSKEEDNISVSADAESDAADLPDSTDSVETAADSTTEIADVSDVLTGSDAFWADDETVDAAVSESSVTAGTSTDAGTISAANAGAVSGTGTASAADTASDTSTTSGSTTTSDTSTTSGSTTASDTSTTSGTAATSGTGATSGTTVASDTGTTSAAGTASDAAATDTDETSGTEAAVAATSRQVQASYTIRTGDTLAEICAKYYGSLERLEELCEVNGIEDADHIIPGQKIVLP